MEEKIYELMEKMYVQMQNMQNGFKELRSEVQDGFAELRGDINRLEKGQVKLENELKEAKSVFLMDINRRMKSLKILKIKLINWLQQSRAMM